MLHSWRPVAIKAPGYRRWAHSLTNSHIRWLHDTQEQQKNCTMPQYNMGLTYRMYYGSRTNGCCCIYAGKTLRMHSPGGSTFLGEMTSWPPRSICYTRHLHPVARKLLLIAPIHGRMTRLSWPRWPVKYRDGLPIHRRSPILVLTRQCPAGSGTRNQLITSPMPQPLLYEAIVRIAQPRSILSTVSAFCYSSSGRAQSQHVWSSDILFQAWLSGTRWMTNCATLSRWLQTNLFFFVFLLVNS